MRMSRGGAASKIHVGLEPKPFLAGDRFPSPPPPSLLRNLSGPFDDALAKTSRGAGHLAGEEAVENYDPRLA